jgi:hypothetical protein
MTKTDNQFRQDSHRPIKVQIVSREIPVENTFGNASYILDFMHYLQNAGCKIDYVLVSPLPHSKYYGYAILSNNLTRLVQVSVKDTVQIGRIVVEYKSWRKILRNLLLQPLRFAYNCLPESWKNSYRSKRDNWQRKLKHEPEFQPWDALATPEEVAFASCRFVRFKPNVVIANYTFLANILESPALDETVLKVILTHDVRYQRSDLYKKLGLTTGESDWSREQESTELRKAKVLLAIQEEDANIFREMAPQCQVICMPKAGVIHYPNVEQVPGRCLFVGSGADHNYYGLQWFLEYVWSIIIEKIPDSSLHVCGTVCDYFQEKTYPNVHFLGRVDDLKPEYSAAEVCLIPLLAGSGLKIKLVEAMSYGRACVSTTVGVLGVSDIAGVTTLVADTPEDFAAAVHTLMINPKQRKSMEEQAHKYIAQKLSPQAAYQPFVDYIYQHMNQVTDNLEGNTHRRWKAHESNKQVTISSDC